MSSGTARPGLRDRLQHAHGDDVGAGEDGRRPLRAGEQFPCAEESAVLGVAGGDDVDVRTPRTTSRGAGRRSPRGRRDEINWGNGIILTPWLLYETYGDTQTMARHYPQMQAFLNYIRTRKAGTGADAYIVDAALADWIAAENTSGRITGTWGYYQIADRMARMAELIGRGGDAAEYRGLASDIKAAFNDAFYNRALGRHTSQGDQGGAGATQAAQALALVEGLVPEGEHDRVLDALVELVRGYQPFGGGPHFARAPSASPRPCGP